MKTIHRAEVLQHNSKEDCWIIIQNNVYDISKIIKNHPGGIDILLSRAGEDATSYFITKHSKDLHVWKYLEYLKIGILPEYEKILTDDFQEPFLIELLDGIYQQKLFSIPVFFKNPYFWVRTINYIFFFLLSYFVLYGNISIVIASLLVFIQAIIGTSQFGYVAHEATHRNFAKNKLNAFFLKLTWPIFWPFINQFGLNYEHNSHHIKIGDPYYDYEVAAFASFIRYSGHVMPKAIHKYQHRLAKFFYPFYANIITTIGGINSTFWSTHNRSIAKRHNLTIIYALCFYIFIPSILTTKGILYFILMYVIYQCTLYFGIYIGSAINHFVPQALSSIPKSFENKYAYYICHNTTNFCSNNKFWEWYTGGFNIQIEHHLVPFVPVENLGKMKNIVLNLCKKYDYPYVDYKSVLELWRDHYDYLYCLSNVNIDENIANEMNNRNSYQGR